MNGPLAAYADRETRRTQNRWFLRALTIRIRRPLIWLTAVTLAFTASVTMPPETTAAAAVSEKEATPYPGGRWQPGPAAYGYTTVATTVTMNDGAELNATVGYPTDLASGDRAGGTFPVILRHHPYDDSIEPYLVEHGYIFANVRPRGTGMSTGNVDLAGPRDWQDGSEIIDWASRKLDGSDGRVGMFGCSYPGFHAMTDAAAVGQNSPLKTVAGLCTGAAPGYFTHEVFLRGGFLTSLARSAAAFGPITGGQAKTNKFWLELEADMLTGDDRAYNREYWKAREQHFAAGLIRNDIPSLLWVGWDDWVETSAFQQMATAQNVYAGRPPDQPMRRGQRVTGRHQMIVGNWGHGEGIDMGILLQWFDTWVKGEDTGISESSSPIHLQDKSSGEWINSSRYPLVDDYTTYHLAKSNKLTSSPMTSPETEDVMWAQPDVAGGKLTYTTEPLTNGATLAGPISSTVYASSSNTNLQFVATLSDVAPDGTVTDVSTYAPVLGSQRKLDPKMTWSDTNGKIIRPWTLQERDGYLVPGQVDRFDIAFEPRLWSVKPGHALRLTLATQTPQEVCSAQVGGTDPCYYTVPQLLTLPGGAYTVQYSEQHDSHINVPLLPYRCLAATRSGTSPTSGNFAMPFDWTTESKCGKRG